MTLTHVMINDIITEQMDRMRNLRKYYPFFVLYESTFSQYKEGRYADLDMGYITLASLRFFINENNFNERDITTDEYERFLSELIRRDFGLQLEESDEKELITYIFDKIKNDGKPFEFRIFDPETKEKKITRVKLIESEIKDGNVFYHVTSDGIEFYLDTKEVKDESKISTSQLLLEKMIKSNNFKGGIDVVKRINNEVIRLKMEKEQVIKLLQIDVYEGNKACEEFMQKTSRWFMDEQKYFAKNKALIDKAISRISIRQAYDEDGRDEGDDKDGNGGYGSRRTTDGDSYIANDPLYEISRLETELKKTIQNHSELISETMELSRISDEIVRRAKLKKLRPVFDFNEVLSNAYKEDDVSKLGIVLAPLFKPRTYKTFSITSIDNILTLKKDDGLKGEEIVKEDADLDYVYDDEKLDMTIGKNFSMLFTELLERLERWGRVSLKELNAILVIKFGEEIYDNRDLYSFYAHLAGEKEYDMKKLIKKQDTMLQEMIIKYMTKETLEQYKDIKFAVEYTDEVINIGPEGDENPGRYVTNMIFDIKK